MCDIIYIVKDKQEKGTVIYMEKTSLKPGTLLAPLPPVMVSCGTYEKPNIITVGWTGIINSQPPMTYISVRKSRFSHEIISNTREFVINLTTADLVRAADFCGVRSGRDVDKFEATGLHVQRSEKIQAPAIDEAVLCLECAVTRVEELGSHDMFYADIVNVRADASLMDKNGRLALDKASLVAYSHGEYFALGKKLGKFGFSVQKKKKHKRPAPTKQGG